ncbi:hypothetical protein IFE17_04495 [Actinobacillus sp. GY-402]|nr:hypothetical protein IFE17_04430 [Actinobacillus sp. GY-402]QOF68639.1 hypothetical protein IFE17_04495 [Actinobacillus sp. GY-402]
MNRDDFYFFLKKDEFDKIKLLNAYHQMNNFDKDIVLVSLMKITHDKLNQDKLNKHKEK